MADHRLSSTKQYHQSAHKEQTSDSLQQRTNHSQKKQQQHKDKPEQDHNEDQNRESQQGIDLTQYKGIYFNENEKQFQDSDTGAHFEFRDICRRLDFIVKSRQLQEQKETELKHQQSLQTYISPIAVKEQVGGDLQSEKQEANVSSSITLPLKESNKVLEKLKVEPEEQAQILGNHQHSQSNHPDVKTQSSFLKKTQFKIKPIEQKPVTYCNLDSSTKNSSHSQNLQTLQDQNNTSWSPKKKQTVYNFNQHILKTASSIACNNKQANAKIPNQLQEQQQKLKHQSMKSTDQSLKDKYASLTKGINKEVKSDAKQSEINGGSQRRDSLTAKNSQSIGKLQSGQKVQVDKAPMMKTQEKPNKFKSPISKPIQNTIQKYHQTVVESGEKPNVQMAKQQLSSKGKSPSFCSVSNKQFNSSLRSTDNASKAKLAKPSDFSKKVDIKQTKFLYDQSIKEFTESILSNKDPNTLSKSRNMYQTQQNIYHKTSKSGSLKGSFANSTAIGGLKDQRNQAMKLFQTQKLAMNTIEDVKGKQRSRNDPNTMILNNNLTQRQALLKSSLGLSKGNKHGKNSLATLTQQLHHLKVVTDQIKMNTQQSMISSRRRSMMQSQDLKSLSKNFDEGGKQENESKRLTNSQLNSIKRVTTKSNEKKWCY